MRSILLIGSIVLGSMFGGFFFYLVITRTSAKDIVVPDVRGMDCEEALDKLKALGFDVVMGSGEDVLGTFPPPGMKVKVMRTIRVFCSRETEGRFDFGNLKSLSVAFAKKLSGYLGLGLKTHEIKLKGEIGKILSQKFFDGELHVLVDVGPIEEFGIVPALVGLSLEDAVEYLKDLNISYSIEGSGDFVVDQFPEPGTVATEVLLRTE